MTSPSMPVAGDFRRLAVLGAPLRRHRTITHVGLTAIALAVTVSLALPTAPSIQAGLMTAPREGSILPAVVGIGVAATDAVVLRFPGPMDQAAVATHLGIAPRTDISLRWNANGSAVALVPTSRWATDERYVIDVPAGTAMADGGSLTADWRASFTTQTAPWLTNVQVAGAAGTLSADTPVVVQDVMASTGASDGGMSAATDDVTPDASASTAVGLTFSAAMNHAETEKAFRITPVVPGTFRWDGTTMWFLPDQRLAPGARYAVAVAGARDADGNPLGGDASFSFTTRPSAEATAVAPPIGAQGVTDPTVTISFSEPMDQAATAAAFALTDASTGERVAGAVAWSADGRTLIFTAGSPLGAGRSYSAEVGSGARDLDRNPVAFSWQFATAGPARLFIPVPSVPASASSVEYALNQLNAARASYGLPALALDGPISAVSYGHAADMLANGYFSHDSLDGTTYTQRLTNGGISYGWSGENQCYLTGGGGEQATLDWCQAQFWVEPYPGYANHKGNILNPSFRRVGIGIATGGGKVVVVWDFTD